MQDQTALQLILNSLDFDMRPEKAVTAPRFGTNHHVGSFGQKAPELGSLLLHANMDSQTIEDLKGRGHKVSVRKGAMGAAPVLLRIDPQTGIIEAAGDPLARRHAAAY
jgi:gamma-glutamyltranspeptidase